MTSNFKAELLHIVIDGHSFSPNADGLWSLNEIHQTLKLDPAKEPSEWRNAIQAELSNSGNLRNKVGRYGGTFADELGAIAYAMWVSTPFYLMVAGAFVAARNGALREVAAKDTMLAANMPKASVMTRKAATHGITWTDACRVAGIQHPRVALESMAKTGHMRRNVDSFGDPTGTYKPSRQGLAVGAFVMVEANGLNREGWRVKTRGLDWLTRNAESVNAATAEIQRNKAAKARKAKASKARKVTQ